MEDKRIEVILHARAKAQSAHTFKQSTICTFFSQGDGSNPDKLAPGPHKNLRDKEKMEKDKHDNEKARPQNKPKPEVEGL
jgi:hypothetical protein